MTLTGKKFLTRISHGKANRGTRILLPIDIDMKYLSAKRVKYLVYMLSVIILILAAFNTYFTLRFHHQLSKIASKPGRWPAGAYIYDKAIGFDFAPGISGYIGDRSYYVKSHQLGYRIGEHEDAGSYRPGGILSLGCSFTYGDEVNSEQTFTQVAADSLNIPAYNYGICSFSYIHALLKARKLKKEGVLDKLQPAYVVLGCWSGLPNRSRTPFPPIEARSLPFPTAYLTKENGGPEIKYPIRIRNVFSMVELYRKEGPGLSFRKFARIFFSAPRYLYLFTKYNKLVQDIRSRTFRNDVKDIEVYDFYFSGIKEVFSDDDTRILVLFMPRRSDEKPDRALKEALAKHPEIILVNGLEAIQKYGVATRDYQAQHPQPAAHNSYGREIVHAIRGR